MEYIKLNRDESDLLYDFTGYKIRCVYKGFFDFNGDFKGDPFKYDEDCYSLHLVTGGTLFFYKKKYKSDFYTYDIIDSFFKSKIRGVKIDKLLNG